MGWLTCSGLGRLQLAQGSFSQLFLEYVSKKRFDILIAIKACSRAFLINFKVAMNFTHCIIEGTNKF